MELGRALSKILLNHLIAGKNYITLNAFMIPRKKLQLLYHRRKRNRPRERSGGKRVIDGFSVTNEKLI